MGMCLDEFGIVGIEVRRESFYLRIGTEEIEVEIGEIHNLKASVLDAIDYLENRSKDA